MAVDSFKTDPLFPRIERAVAAILASGKLVTPVDALIRMELLKPEDVENWRFGRIAYLERDSPQPDEARTGPAYTAHACP